MFDSIGFDISLDNPTPFVVPTDKQCVIISMQMSNMSEFEKTSARVDLLDSSGNRISTPIKKLPLDPDESGLIDTKIFVSNGNKLLFTTPNNSVVSVTVSYYLV